MKTKILAGFFVMLAAGFIPAQAGDNPSQATAREALVKKLFELDQSKSQPSPGWDSGAVVAGPGKSTNRPIKSVTAKAAIPPTAPVATNSMASPVKEVAAAAPVVAIKSVAVPAKPQPLAAVPVTPKANVTDPAAKAAQPKTKMPPANDLVTTTGAIYRAAVVSKVESDGLIISYVPRGGGIAITKLYFEDLPAELRQQYEPKKQ